MGQMGGGVGCVIVSINVMNYLHVDYGNIHLNRNYANTLYISLIAT